MPLDGKRGEKGEMESLPRMSHQLTVDFLM